MASKQDISLDKALQVRINGRDLKKFISKSKKLTGRPYTELLREMIIAFNEDRVRIIKTDEQKKGKLYVD